MLAAKMTLIPLDTPPPTCHNAPKPKGPVLQNTFGSAVAAPTVKRGFVTPDFWGGACWARSKVLGGMGLTARLAARLNPCFEHPVHPLRFKTHRVGL